MFKKLDLYAKDAKSSEYYHLGYLKGIGGDEIVFVADNGTITNIDVIISKTLTDIEIC